MRFQESGRILKIFFLKFGKKNRSAFVVIHQKKIQGRQKSVVKRSIPACRMKDITEFSLEINLQIVSYLSPKDIASLSLYNFVFLNFKFEIY